MHLWTTMVPVKLQSSLKIQRNVVAVVYSTFQSSWSRKNVHKDRDNIRQQCSDRPITTTQRLLSIFTERDVLIHEKYRFKRAKCRQIRYQVVEKCFPSTIPKTWSRYDHHNENYRAKKGQMLHDFNGSFQNLIILLPLSPWKSSKFLRNP